MTIKQLVVLILVSTYSLCAFTRTDTSMAVCQKGGVPSNSDINEMESLASGIESAELETLTTRMCQHLVLANSNDISSVGTEIENYILDFNGWTRETPNYQRRISEFWNEHNEQLICRNHRHVYPEQHFFMRVVEMKMYTPVLVEYMLQDETVYPIDVNVTQNVNGRDETVLDYIDSILNDPNRRRQFNVNEIRGLREILVTFYNAKHAREL